MLYTRKGDKGDTYFFGCKQRFSKNSALAEALGSVDEINSLLGVCKVKSGKIKIKINKKNIFLADIIEKIQNHLFIIQAELAGYVLPKAKLKADVDKKISKEKIEFLEKIVNEIEKQLPPIKSFFIAGGTEISALFDYARAVSRRAERMVVAFSESEKNKVSPEILAYLNRLSSALYALSRICNAVSGIKEKIPPY